MILLQNINEILTLRNCYLKDGRNLSHNENDIIKNGAIIFDQNKIQWVGETSNIPKEFKPKKIYDLKGYCLTPELVDCHTHLIFGGDRSQEYIQKLNGIDYQEIAKNGGGILFTQNETRKLSHPELFELGKSRINEIYHLGVGTIEIKSGYSLNFEHEYIVSHVINELKNFFHPKIQIINTFMAAHAVPKEFNSSSEYLKNCVIPLLDKLNNEKIIDFVDIFHEQGYFNDYDVKLLFEFCHKNNIKTKIHADEFNDNNGAKLAIDFLSQSCEHLLMTNDENIKLLGKSNTVCCLLPGTAFFLGKKQVDAQKLFQNSCKVALATDFNPGSSHINNLLLLASIAAPTYKMNFYQLWSSITLNAAHALALNNQGAIVIGLDSRFTFFKCNKLEDITYNWGKNYVDRNLLF